MDSPVPGSLPYFITADAGYCHILPDKIVLSPHTALAELPTSEDKKDKTTLFLGSAGVLLGCFLMVNFFLVGFYLMGILFLGGMTFAVKALRDIARYSAILNIPRDLVQKVQVFKPAFGYLYIVIKFRNAAGGSSLRKIKFYDSPQNELNALYLLKQEGLID
jgi:hypothetical protein